MDPAFRVVFILLIVFGSIFLGRYLKHRDRMFELKLKAEKEFAGELKIEMEKIRDRLATLETIVTSKGYRLQDDIDKL